VGGRGTTLEIVVKILMCLMMMRTVDNKSKTIVDDCCMDDISKRTGALILHIFNVIITF